MSNETTTPSQGADLQSMRDTVSPPPIEERPPSDCRTAENFFEAEIWPRVIEPVCLDCHVPGGAAGNSEFVLIPIIDNTDFLNAHFDAIRSLALERVPSASNRSRLELMPTNTIPHGGATAIEPDSVLHELLLDFIARVDGVPCQEEIEVSPVVPFYEDVLFADPAFLLRQVALSLAGRLPKGSEISTIQTQGMDGLHTILDGMMTEEGFRNRLKEGFADIFLTHGYDGTSGQLLSYEHFPTRSWTSAGALPGVPDETRWKMDDDYDDALREEPMELIAHIVMNERPFTEILTADYFMVSPYTARGYGVYDEVVGRFTDAEDPFEFIEAQLPSLLDRSGNAQPSPTGVFPHAGILGTFQYLHRYPSTDTNRNRARARMFFSHFLGVDVMASAPAVTDAAAVTARYDNPTMEAPDCVTCHRIIDPVAGLFRDFDNVGDFSSDDTWHTDMFSPGWGTEGIEESDRWRSLQWLSERAAVDDRFPVAMTEHVYYILTQDSVLLPPSESESHFSARRRGYDAQREAIYDAARAFRESGFNLKEIFRSLIHSKFYRSVGVATPITTGDRQVELGVLGLGTMLTPEQLQRKLRAIFGSAIELPLGEVYYGLYGGVDYKQVIERPSIPNGVMGALMRWMASSISCAEVPRWLTGEGRGEHDLFVHVDADTRDETRLRDNIVHLHGLILGQHLQRNDPEIDRSLGLFERVVAAGESRVSSGEEDHRLVYNCRRYLATEPDDSDYVIRGWQALVTYLLRRPEVFLQ
jgi:hypothetical protein